MTEKEENHLVEVKKISSDLFRRFMDKIKSFLFLQQTDEQDAIVSSINKIEGSKNIDELMNELETVLSAFVEKAQNIEENYRASIKSLPLETQQTMPSAIEEPCKPKSDINIEYQAEVEEGASISNLKDSIRDKELSTSTFINAQILVSAGPRKEKENDTELGEDACGIMHTSTGIYFWILDGTSDSPGLYYQKTHVFSSRILAQQMSSSIKSTLSNSAGSSIDLRAVLSASVEDTKNSLLERVKNASPEISQKIEDGIKKSIYYFCSTTVLLGFYSIQGDLFYLNLGDSEVKPFSTPDNDEKSWLIEPNTNPSRLFISINFEDNELILKTNKFEEKIVEDCIRDVDSLAAYSDGVKTLQSETTPNRLADISFQYQNTYDDKCLIILERKSY